MRQKNEGVCTLIVFCALLFVCGVVGLEIEVFVVSHVTCNGRRDGVAKVNIINGDPPYGYYWPVSGESTPTASQLPAGILNVSVKDSSGAVTQSVNILQPSALQVAQYWYTNLASCDAPGVVSAIAYGGTPPYSYSWSGDDNGLKVLPTDTPVVVYSEDINTMFTIADSSQSVDLHSTDILAFSGIFSMKIQSIKAQQFAIQCASDFMCIETTKSRGLEFWAWKDAGDSSSTFFVGLIDEDGEEHGVKEFRFVENNWTRGFLEFADLSPALYFGISIATNGGFQFYLDDIVLLPESVVSNNQSSSGPLPVGTPSAVQGNAGSYTIQITDANKCNTELSMDIIFTLPLKTTVSVADKTITLTTYGGTPPYTYYLLNHTSSKGVFNDMGPGNYTINIVDSRQCRDILEVTVTEDGGDPPIPTAPPIGPDLNSDRNYELVNATLGCIAIICCVLTILCAIYVRKRQEDLRPHSPFFCYTILFGAFIGYIAAILSLISDVTWLRSIAFSWTVDTSVTIIYGTMFAKSMQILKILDNFTKFVSIDTTDRYMAKIFCMIIFPELIILFVWSGLCGSVLQSYVSASESSVIFWNIFLIYKGIVGLITCFVCFRMRFKFKEYAEIKDIAYCQIALEIILIFMLVFTLIARERYSELFVAVQSFTVMAIVSIPLLVIFVPLLRRGVKDWKEEKRTRKWQKLTMYT